MKRDMKIFPHWIKATLVLAVLALLAAGAWFYHSQGQIVQNNIEEELTIIAQLKRDQIVAWRKERLGDAAVLSGSPFFILGVVDFLHDRSDENTHGLLSYFQSIQENFHYADILLVDPDGKVLLSVSENTLTHSAYAPVLPIALRERTPVFIDLHNEMQDLKPHISVVAPLFTVVQHAQKPIGALILVSDASQFLYPLIQSWPNNRKTEETLLVRRDRDDVLFLNNLRHQPDAALKLRIPLSRLNLPASMAVSGQKGIVMGKDYRGVEVMSVILPIPDSPWFMVTKIDAAEVFAEWRFRSGLILAFLTVIGMIIVAFGLLFRQWELKAHYRALYLFETSLRRNVERQSIILRSIGDAVISIDARGRAEMLNPMAETLTGWTDAEARGKPIEAVFHIVNEETGEKVENPVAKILREGIAVGLSHHTLLIAKDGTRRSNAFSGAPIRDKNNEITGAVLVIRDQTEERWNRRLNETRSVLIEYAATHTLGELMTKALDEIDELIDSPIGFFHCMELDQKTLSLQQWSTRTLNEFCRAESEGPHYPIERAGVWADCARQKKPTIHNDYGSLKHKQGLPEGHAQLIRELVVPVIRKDNVVAILGVGNKSIDYTEIDVKIVSMLADVAWEILERKRIENARQDSEKRYRRLFESAKDGILILDADTGKVLDVNPFLSQLLGIPHKAFLGKHLWDLGPFASIAASKKAFKILQDKEYIRYDDLPLKTHDGRVIDVEFVSNVYLVDHARVIQCNIRDITKRKQTETEREGLLSAIEQTGEMIVITDTEGDIQYVNSAFERVTGYSRKEAIGQNPRILKSGRQDPPFYRNLWKTISSGGIFHGRMVNKRKDGTFFTEEATISPALDASGQIVNYIAVKHDITENLRMTAQLQQAQKMESVGRLAGGVAHDFNNMLSVIHGYTELALERVESSEPLHADLTEILNAAKRSTEITRQLLAFARRQTINPKVLDVNETVEGMLKMLRRLIGEDIDLVWQPKSAVWEVKIDPIQIDQILANLCINARDAIAGVGKVRIETTAVTFDEDYCSNHVGFITGEFVLLSVSDDGCGMDKQTLDSIFEPFFTTKGVNQGTGLGLATIYGIVKQNNGFINVYSEPGMGTIFKIYFPRYMGSTEKISAEIGTEIPTSHGEIVLLVEDESVIRNMGRGMLERLGYQVMTADTPGEALRLADECAGKIHLLITDVIMPEMNGRDLADQLHTLYPDIKILFMSGYTADVIAHRGVLDESVHFIQKPFTKKELAFKVKEVLDRADI